MKKFPEMVDNHIEVMWYLHLRSAIKRERIDFADLWVDLQLDFDWIKWLIIIIEIKERLNINLKYIFMNSLKY